MQYEISNVKALVIDEIKKMDKPKFICVDTYKFNPFDQLNGSI